MALSLLRASTSVARSTAPRAMIARQSSSGSELSQSLLYADSVKGAAHVMHNTSKALAVLAPISLAFGPSLLTAPVDMALAVAVPYHMQLGLNTVASDYVPKDFRGLAGGVITAMSGITLLGLVKINMGEGVTETVKDFWRQPAIKEESE